MHILKSRHFNNNNGQTNITGIFVRTYNKTDGFSNWFKIV